MRDNAGGRQVQSHGDVHQWLAIVEDGGDELVHEIPVRAAVAAGVDRGRERRALEIEARERAFELAKSGAFSRFADINSQLRRDGYSTVAISSYLTGLSVQREMKAILGKAGMRA